MATVLNAFGIPDQDRMNWKLIRARAAYWGSMIAMFLTLSLVFLPIIMRGIRIAFPSMAIKSAIGIDGATVLACLLLCAVPLFWRLILQSWLGVEGIFESLGRYHENHKILVWVLGIIVLGADGWAFLHAVSETEGAWGESLFSFSACILTLGYMACVVAMSYFSLVLKARVDAIEAELAEETESSAPPTPASKGVSTASMALIALAFTLCASPAFAQRGTFAASESKYVVSQLVDMSGSFAEKMADQGAGFRFTTGMIDRYFRARVASADRLINGQISGKEETLLWEGLPVHLRKQYTPETFARFLRTNSDPAGSRVYDGISDSIEYLLDDPAVKCGQAKSAVLICSDMIETSPMAAESEKRLTTALKAYARTGGVVGIYYCNQRLVPVWRKRLREAGVREFVVESEIVGKPSFPNFED